MKEKNYGNLNMSNTLLGVLMYAVVASLAVFAIKFLYAFVSVRLGYSLIIIDLFIWLQIVALVGWVATKIIVLFKVENARVFSFLTIIFSGWIFYIYYYGVVAGSTASVGVFASPFDFELIGTLFSDGFVLSIKSSSFDTPGVINYLCGIVVLVGFVLPKGDFSFDYGVYINGENTEFKVYYLFSPTVINEDTLTSEDEICILDDYDLERRDLERGKYYSLYVSENRANPVYHLVSNKRRRRNHGSKLILSDRGRYYKTLSSDIQNKLSSFEPYDKAEGFEE